VLGEASRQFPGHGSLWLNYAVVLEALGATAEAREARRHADTLMTPEQRATLVR
jgi:hypothetical protein